MADELESRPGAGSLVKNVALGGLALYVIFSLYFGYQMSTRLDALEGKQKLSEKALQAKIAASHSEFQASTESLAAKVGTTQKELAAKASALQNQQRQTEQRLSEEQLKQQAALGAVSGEVAGVKTDVGGVKTDVASTKNDLAATKAKLERAMGDLGLQSGLIATTREDLELLKHRGDRNYYEFTLSKNASPTPLSTISLQLKKTDKKKGKFSVNVLADDRTIEKKDRTMNEPLQFYTGRDKLLYEVVVFNVDKDKVTGYLSTPKTAPAPIVR